MPALRDLQQRFAAGLRGDGPAGRNLAVYRATVSANYRAAMAATYPVVRLIVGGAFFDTAVDAYTAAFPSTGGDLNVYGGRFGDWLAAYPYAVHLPYLADVARLEWAIDEAARAADCDATPARVLDALSRATADSVPMLHPSARLVASRHPVWRIWHVHQPGYSGDMAVNLDDTDERVIVHREANAIAVERVPPAEWTFLEALRAGAALGIALERALAHDDAFDLAPTLSRRVQDGTIVGVSD